MSLDQHPKLQEIINAGYAFELGDYISQGFDIFKKNIGGFVGYTLLSGLIITVAGIIPLINIFAYLVLVPALFVGYYLVAHRLARGERSDFGDFFKGFDYTGQLLLWFLLVFLAVLILMIPAGIAMYSTFSNFANIDSSEYMDNPFWIYSVIPAWAYLFYLPIIYLGVSWRWAPMFIIFNKMNAWDAIVMSHRITAKTWWMQLLFCFVLYVIAMVGFLVLLVGALFTYPAVLCMDYAAFAQVTQLNREATPLDNLEEHLVE